ncbi:MAG: hypothetical protein EOO88_57340 [Pedobacter sp.]|nr:MAG: hypothetical protein EOO88_57340 [Pedobacter sp.]
MEKDNSTMWWYRDFSTSETAQNILDTHHLLVEEIYANASFRSEFMTIAKLWHTHDLFVQASHQDPPPTEQQTHFPFVRYDQIGYDPSWTTANQHMQACALLRSSVEKALHKQYGLDIDEIRRLTLDVISRHMQEMYSSGLYDF